MYLSTENSQIKRLTDVESLIHVNSLIYVSNLALKRVTRISFEFCMYFWTEYLFRIENEKKLFEGLMP